MKNYSTPVAAQTLVGKSVRLGASRHHNREEKLRIITSVGTARNHASALKLAGDWLLESKGKHLKNMTADDAAEYLCLRAMTVGQSAVDLARQAINFHLLHKAPVPFVSAQVQRELTNRAYTRAQIELLVLEASPKLKLSISLALDAGLRAHELITISTPQDLNESQRRGWVSNRFAGRDHDANFVVHGKGGLCRSVKITAPLADTLMEQVRPTMLAVSDRGVNYDSYFNLVGGSNFSMQFSKLSMAVLGFSHGAHGLRHSFAQARLHDLMCIGLKYTNALDILSNELGHFSTSNTLAYLRN